MEDKDKNADGTAITPTPGEEKKGEGEPIIPTVPADTGDKGDGVDGVDYKKEFEALMQEHEKAQHKLKQYNIDGKGDKKKDEPKGDDDDDEYIGRQDTEKLIDERVKGQLTNLQQDIVLDLIENELEAATTNADERKLIQFHYENSIVKTGYNRASIRRDMDKAKLLANAVRYRKESKEAGETAKAKKTMGNSGMGTNLDKPMPPEDLKKMFTEFEWQFMQRRGWKEDQIKKAAQAKIEARNAR